MARNKPILFKPTPENVKSSTTRKSKTSIALPVKSAITKKASRSESIRVANKEIKMKTPREPIAPIAPIAPRASNPQLSDTQKAQNLFNEAKEIGVLHNFSVSQLEKKENREQLHRLIGRHKKIYDFKHMKSELDSIERQMNAK